MGNVHRIAVLSDTHGRLRREVAEVLETCEVILHAGDINRRSTLEELERIAPVYAVRGNGDKGWAEGMAKELETMLFGLHICMIHDRKEWKGNPEGKDLIICGHTHRYEEKRVKGTLFFNPGSCGPRRFRLPVTMAVLEVQEETGEWKIEKIDLTEKVERAAGPTGLEEGNLKQMVEAILKEMRAGRRVDVIAGRLGVERGFVEQVCRIYVTQPGVDAQGIVNKIEVSELFEHRAGH